MGVSMNVRLCVNTKIVDSAQSVSQNSPTSNPKCVARKTNPTTPAISRVSEVNPPPLRSMPSQTSALLQDRLKCSKHAQYEYQSTPTPFYHLSIPTESRQLFPSAHQHCNSAVYGVSTLASISFFTPLLLQSGYYYSLALSSCSPAETWTKKVYKWRNLNGQGVSYL